MCFYHPDIEADTKCEKYSKLLCLRCQKTCHTDFIHPRYAGTTGGRYPECYEMKKNLRINYQLIMCIITIIVAIGILAAFISFSSTMGPGF
ncbi:MAG: hypothetical protein ACFE8P_17805 [Promethearchaeota archaeon]